MKFFKKSKFLSLLIIFCMFYNYGFSNYIIIYPDFKPTEKEKRVGKAVLIYGSAFCLFLLVAEYLTKRDKTPYQGNNPEPDYDPPRYRCSYSLPETPKKDPDDNKKPKPDPKIKPFWEYTKNGYRKIESQKKEYDITKISPAKGSWELTKTGYRKIKKSLN